MDNEAFIQRIDAVLFEEEPKLLALQSYLGHQALVDVPKLTDGGFPSALDIPSNVVHFRNGDG